MCNEFFNTSYPHWSTRGEVGGGRDGNLVKVKLDYLGGQSHSIIKHSASPLIYNVWHYL